MSEINEMSETTEVPNESNGKTSVITVRLSYDERKMVDTLKGPPHFMNISEYIRATIRHIYESKTSKAGRVK